jgi:hypothetical protein
MTTTAGSTAAASDLFSEALAITHSYGEGATSQQQRLLAEGYLMELRQSADGLNLAFHIISNEPVNDIRCFWAFNTVMHHLPQISPGLDTAQSMQIYATLSLWLMRHTTRQAQAGPSVPDFLLNKHAQMMVVGVQEFFPLRWQSFFADLLQMFERREMAPPHVRDQWALYFLRIFEYIDERVVCVRAQGDRPRELRLRDMAVKDAMREQVIAAATGVWYALLLEYRTKSSDMMKVCLSVIASYIEWIDIQLMVSSDWLNLFYHLTTVPVVRQGSVECLVNLVAKKQLTPIKVETLTRMRLVGDALPQIVRMLPIPVTDEEEEAFLLDVANLAVSTASELLQCCQATSEQGSAEAQVMLHVVLPEIVRIFSMPLVQVVEIVLPFVQQYVKSALVTESEATEFLHVIYRHTVLPDAVLDNTPDEFVELRKTLHNMLRLLLRRFPHLVHAHCKQVAGTVLAVTVQHLPAPEAEAALLYVFELGEAFRMDQLKDTNNDVAQIVNSLLCSETLPSHPHPAVHTAYFEMLDRYHAFFIHHRSQVPLVLGRFLLQPCGIANANAKARSRICYLFGHLLQVLKVQFAEHAEHIVSAMKTIFTSTVFSPSDKFDLYEGLGTLLSVSDVMVSATVADTIVRNLQTARRMGAGATDAVLITVADDITFLSQFAKGIGGSEALRMPDSPPLMPKADPSPSGGAQFPPTLTLSDAVGPGGVSAAESHVAHVFCTVTREVMLVHEHFQSVPLVRERVCLYMHQMVNILPYSAIVEFFESFVQRSLRCLQTVNELPKVLRVVYQFVNKTRGASVTVTASLLPEIVARVQQVGEVVQVRAELGVVSEQTKELLEVLKTYFSLVHAISHTSALPALLSAPAVQCLSKILGDLVDATKVSAEFELPKQALQILSRLAFQWVAAGPDLQWFEAWMLELAIPSILDVATNFAGYGYNLHDAKIFMLVGELCQMLKTVVHKSPERGFCSVFATFTRVLGLQESEAFEVCNKLREDPRASAQFKSQFRAMLERVQIARACVNTT